MPLPHPLPDNPLKWTGWKNYNSGNPYERLCLDFESNPGNEEIEEHWRQLLVWWQKKLPLKAQPSNPMAQLLRAGLDEAPAKLSEARSLLMNPEARKEIDSRVLSTAHDLAITEFNKFLTFALTTGKLDADEEESLYITGAQLGLQKPEMERRITDTLREKGFKRVPRELPPTASRPVEQPPSPAPVVTPPPAPSASPVAPTTSAGSRREEFLRMLRLSGIDELTDDQRDAFCNMGEALGMSGGDAEDIIDEYLEEMMIKGSAAAKPASNPKPAPARKPLVQRKETRFVNSPLQRAEEKKRHAPFTNRSGIAMLLVSSGSFQMGSHSLEAAANEQPVTLTNLTAFYLSRWPVTNAQYELFDPSHRAKRAPWADDHHPVIYVSARDAEAFCRWLSGREGASYRLPTEAEWEYAARGPGNLTYPWGETPPRGIEANLADANTRFPWAELSINDGYAATSPVGSYPRGASPFGIEDLAGNVWEWCADGMVAYPGKERTNPRGPAESPKRCCRGGSWKSRLASLRASARSFNAPTHAAHDIGFRVVCEITG